MNEEKMQYPKTFHKELQHCSNQSIYKCSIYPNLLGLSDNNTNEIR